MIKTHFQRLPELAALNYCLTVKEFVSVSFDILYTMSANLAGGALLAKTLQMTIA